MPYMGLYPFTTLMYGMCFVLCLRCLQTNGVAAGADGSHSKCRLRCKDRHMWRRQTGVFPSSADTLLRGFC